MKKFLSLVLVVILFTACGQEVNVPTFSNK